MASFAMIGFQWYGTLLQVTRSSCDIYLNNLGDPIVPCLTFAEHFCVPIERPKPCPGCWAY